MPGFRFDPRLFILPPYVDCPACGRAEAYGVLMINALSYRRRCRECWHSDECPLPEVRKKVIYLDQMAISNMAKVLLGRAVDAFWRELLERLDVLCKMQLVICPDSQAHREESAVAPYADALRDMYEMFSHGASFDFPHEVVQGQLLEHLDNWLAGAPTRVLDLNVEDVTNGQIHGWQERFYIRVDSLTDGDWIEELRRSRSRGHAGITAVFQRWQQEAHFDFEAMYDRELRSFGEVTMAQHVRSLETQAGAVRQASERTP
jgi:hypothetical protein